MPSFRLFFLQVEETFRKFVTFMKLSASAYAIQRKSITSNNEVNKNVRKSITCKRRVRYVVLNISME